MKLIRDRTGHRIALKADINLLPTRPRFERRFVLYLLIGSIGPLFISIILIVSSLFVNNRTMTVSEQMNELRVKIQQVSTMKSVSPAVTLYNQLDAQIKGIQVSNVDWVAIWDSMTTAMPASMRWNAASSEWVTHENKQALQIRLNCETTDVSDIPDYYDALLAKTGAVHIQFITWDGNTVLGEGASPYFKVEYTLIILDEEGKPL